MVLMVVIGCSDDCGICGDDNCNDDDDTGRRDGISRGEFCWRGQRLQRSPSQRQQIFNYEAIRRQLPPFFFSAISELTHLACVSLW